MAAADISLNELTGANPLEAFLLESPLNVFEFGVPNSVSEVLHRIFPEEFAQAIGFGVPLVFSAVWPQPVSIAVVCQFGEPYVFTTGLVTDFGFAVSCRFGEPYVYAVGFVLPFDFAVSCRFGEPFVGTAAPSPLPPNIINMLPPPPGPLSEGSTWEADIQGDIAELLVWAAYDDLPLVEMIYDGSGFTPNFSGPSSLAEIGGLLHVYVKRGGGWPAAPRIYVRARTTDGGVNT